MKIVITTLTGARAEFVISDNANIRELRSNIFKALALSFHEYILVIRNEDRTNECAVYLDDFPDELLIDHIKKHGSNAEWKLENLRIFLIMSFGPRCYRRTVYNPEGLSLHANRIDEPDNLFFKLAAEPDPQNSFSKRLEKLQIELESIPEAFLDPITAKVMDNPVITSTQRVFDQSTLKTLNDVDPYSKERIESILTNLYLRAQLEAYISEKEASHKMQTDQKTAAERAGAVAAGAGAGNPANHGAVSANAVADGSGAAAAAGVGAGAAMLINYGNAAAGAAGSADTSSTTIPKAASKK